MPKHKVSRDAREDLLQIFEYIAEDNLTAAIAFEDELRDCFSMLAIWREAGRRRSELGKGLRSFPVGGYSIIYRPDDTSSITIVRVLHGSRDIESAVSEDNTL